MSLTTVLPSVAPLLRVVAEGTSETRELIIQVTYLIASVMFILGLRSLTKPDQARRGMQLAAVGMLLAIIGTIAPP